MGYSNNEQTLRSRLDLIEPLLEGKEVTWQVVPGHENQLAYKIRECLRIARKNPEKFPEFARISRSYRINVPRPGTVTATLLEPIPEVKVITSPALETLTAQTANSAAAIIQYILDIEKRGAAPRKINYSGVTLPPAELRKLYNWGKASGWLMFVSKLGIVIQQHDESLVEFAFDPETDL